MVYSLLKKMRAHENLKIKISGEEEKILSYGKMPTNKWKWNDGNGQSPFGNHGVSY